METKNQISEISVGLHEIETFLKVFGDFAREFPDKDKLEYANGVVSMISMESAKIDKLIEIADNLEGAK